MKNQELRDLYLNWKGLEFIHSLKSMIKWAVIVLSLGFTFVSLSIQNYYILGVSLILGFLQILSENKKEYYLKYKEIFEKIKEGKKYSSYRDWINFLEGTNSLNSIQKWLFGMFFNKKFDELMNDETSNKIKINHPKKE